MASLAPSVLRSSARRAAQVSLMEERALQVLARSRVAAGGVDAHRAVALVETLPQRHCSMQRHEQSG